MRLLLIILTVFTVSLAYTPFCSGYNAGYKQGYCYGKHYCLAPIVPICPIPDIGYSTFNDGYNRGFVDGLGDQR